VYADARVHETLIPMVAPRRRRCVVRAPLLRVLNPTDLGFAAARHDAGVTADAQTGAAAAIRSVGAVHSHTRRARAAGATREQ
jgi:hypothetical protein